MQALLKTLQIIKVAKLQELQSCNRGLGESEIFREVTKLLSYNNIILLKSESFCSNTIMARTAITCFHIIDTAEKNE